MRVKTQGVSFGFFLLIDLFQLARCADLDTRPSGYSPLSRMSVCFDKLERDITFNKVRYLENHREKNDAGYFIGPVCARAKTFVQGPMAKQ